MDIKEVRDKRDILEQEISRLLDSFEESAGVKVDGLVVDRFRASDGSVKDLNYKYMVQASIKL